MMEDLYNRDDPWCLMLSEDMMDERDFSAEETIDLDWKVSLPKSFSLWEWIYMTNYQNWWGSCTSNATSHGVQVLAVKSKWNKPTTSNIVTPDWRNLWANMGHDIKDKNDSGDYIDKAVKVAYQNWITNVEWWVSRFDWYAYNSWTADDKWIEAIKRYLYMWIPVVWGIRGNKTTWNEMTIWRLKTIIPANERTWWHAICCVWWEEWWLWFVNSWKTNDWKGLKSRFFVSNDYLKNCWMFNWRYWLPFIKEQTKVDTEYLKHKNDAISVLKELKKMYPTEKSNVKKAIEWLSKAFRENYPEINKELPVNW